MTTTKPKPKKATKEKKINRVLRISVELDEWLCTKAREKYGSSEPQGFIRSVLWELFQAHKEPPA
jgi:hypothetical protein